MRQVVPVSRQLQIELRNECCSEKRLQTARWAVWLSQLTTLWCNEYWVTPTSSKADKHSILQKASVPCSIRNEAGQSGKTVDQRQSLQQSPELKMSDQLSASHKGDKKHWDFIFFFFNFIWELKFEIRNMLVLLIHTDCFQVVWKKPLLFLQNIS